ncbi:MAG: hypothetical protein ACM3MK_04570, partial [Chitinophagales bacterium]
MKVQTLYKLLEETLASFKGFIIVDPEGHLAAITRNYAEALGYTDPAEVIGLPVEDIIPGTKMMETLQTGVANIGDVWNLHGETMVVNRLPLKINGRVVGAVAFDVFR